MQYSNYRLSLDVQTGSSGAVLTAKRGDTGRKIYVNLTDGGRPYFPEADCMAVFTARKPDGHVIFQECAWDGAVICYVLSEQLLAVPGEVKCELRLYGKDAMLLTSGDFDLLVEDTVFHEGDEVESSDDISVLTALIGKNQQLQQDLAVLLEMLKADVGDEIILGITPQIGKNGNWFLGDLDTGKPSRGETGLPGAPGKDAKLNRPVIFTDRSNAQNYLVYVEDGQPLLLPIKSGTGETIILQDRTSGVLYLLYANFGDLHIEEIGEGTPKDNIKVTDKLTWLDYSLFVDKGEMQICEV